MKCAEEVSTIAYLLITQIALILFEKLKNSNELLLYGKSLYLVTSRISVTIPTILFRIFYTFLAKIPVIAQHDLYLF